MDPYGGRILRRAPTSKRQTPTPRDKPVTFPQVRKQPLPPAYSPMAQPPPLETGWGLVWRSAGLDRLFPENPGQVGALLGTIACKQRVRGGSPSNSMWATSWQGRSGVNGGGRGVQGLYREQILRTWEAVLAPLTSRGSRLWAGKKINITHSDWREQKSYCPGSSGFMGSPAPLQRTVAGCFGAHQAAGLQGRWSPSLRDRR